MTFSIHPIALTALTAAVIGFALALLAFRASRTGTRVAFTVAALLCLLPAAYIFVLFHPELIDARFRSYKAFYKDIREGMTRDDVLALLARRYPANGARQRPTVMTDEPTRLGFFMNPESSREPNCEGIFLTLRDGRVTNKDYSPD